MTTNKYAQLLFKHIDRELDRKAKHLRNRIFSLYRDIPWTDEQYRSLQPLIREEFELLIRRLLNSLENVGGVLPEGVLGYTITASDYDQDGKNIIELPIREGAFPDYGEMWLEYLMHKQSREE
jgi:hypothetical protein